ncbi:hypothetical protein TrVFT333_006686 [Trichoderma virens FT-333]|nr:hypothetical protein TrVFT333_006686 [Trichoderma virens FT-333]
MAGLPFGDSNWANFNQVPVEEFGFGPPTEYFGPFSDDTQLAEDFFTEGSAFSSSAHSGKETWVPEGGSTQISDLAEQRRIQNRIAQRNYRKKLNRRLEDLERRAGPEQSDAEKQPWTDYGLEPRLLNHELVAFEGWSWSPEEDQLLFIAHMLGLTWAEIRDQFFPSKTASACSNRLEWLQVMKRKGDDGWSAPKIHALAKEYMSMREEIWSGLAARMGEIWNVVEEKCIPQTSDGFQSATHEAEGRLGFIKEYMSMRKEIWSGLAARVEEKWDVVEEKCISKGLYSLKRTADILEKRSKLAYLKAQRELPELDTSRINSDGEAFSQMKKAYLQYRGMRSRLRFLIKPVTVEFVRFTLWSLRHGYVSVCDRPNSMPPNTRIDYDFIPPPMPPEVFVHYLEHGDGDLSPNRYTWLPRLPKRLNNKVMDCGEATEGWGIHVIEGPNREAVFWVLMATISASVVASVLWATLKGDIQGGTGLGALIVALPPAIMAAFLFRLGAA